MILLFHSKFLRMGNDILFVSKLKYFTWESTS